MDLNNKKIILTGASSGIGKEILKQLQKYDVKIIAVGRDICKIPEVKNKVIPFECDVSKKEEVDKLFDFAVKTLGGIDIFIANAGFAFCENIEEANWEHIEQIFSTNVFSPIYSTEKMRVLNRNRKYSIVITCSAVSEIPLPGYSLYCSTKYAINGFGRVFMNETRENEIISLVYPISTSTNFFKNAADKAPIPWPVQRPEKVAHSVIKGIIRENKFIYPSKYFASTRVLSRVFPFMTSMYVKIQRNKFNRWVQSQNSSI